MKKLLAVLISVFLLAMGGLILTACGGKDGGGNTNGGDEQIRAVYNQYVAYADEKGETPLSYEEWLKTIKGEDGKSAYQIWLDNGNTGSEQDFLNWLKGGGQANVETLQYRMNLDRKSYCVIGVGTVSDLDVVIPSTYRGLPVTSIGYQAFYSFDKLLTSIEIPETITVISSEAFYYCSSLTKVNYLGTVDQWAQIEFHGEQSNPLEGSGADLYINNQLLTQAKITTATKISYNAFTNCDSLTSVIIGDSVTSIDYYAFESCDSLTSVVIGNSVASIDDRAFAGCSKLIEVYNLSSLPIKAGSSDYGKVGYYAKVVHTDKNEPSILTTDSNGFVTINDNGVKTLISYVGNATDIVIPNGIKKINDYAFYNCDSLTSIVIPDSVTNIGSYAFSSCSSLTSVVIPDNVTSIGSYAFSSCDSLTTIYCEAESKPDGWDRYWNYTGAKVVWGYKG